MQNDSYVHLPSPCRPAVQTPTVFNQPSLKGHNLFETSIDEIQHLYSMRAFTAKEYTQFCLDRIQATHPYLEAVIETNPDALSIAEQLDIERAGGKVRGPLHGIPALVKDNIATADSMQTTAGSWALLGSIVPKDAHVVKCLRDAGAIIIGKANMSEWAAMRDSVSSDGYTPRGGQCRNPYDLTRSASGSSSGSAVCVSANVVPFALGTETDTSIIGPASICGVVGIKPTVGLTSRAGVIPISENQDTVGPIGRTVADAACALDVIASVDEEDRFTTVITRRQPRSYLPYLTDRNALRGARFGLPMNCFWDVVPARQRSVAEKVLGWIKEAGALIVPVNMPCAEERIPGGEWDWERYVNSQPEKSEGYVCNVEFCYLMERYLSQLKNTSIKSLEDIVKFNDENSGSEGGKPGILPGLWTGQDLFRKSLETKGIKDETYHAALKHIQSQCRENGIDAALAYEDGCGNTKSYDALIFCDIKLGGQTIAAQAGYPIVSIPIGLDVDGMPIPLTLQHTAWEEARLIKWASAIEDLVREKTGPRETPTFKNHLRKNVPIGPTWVIAD